MGQPIWNPPEERWFSMPKSMQWSGFLSAMDSQGWNGGFDSDWSFEEAGLRVPPDRHDARTALWVFQNATRKCFGAMVLDDAGTPYVVLMIRIPTLVDPIVDCVTRLGLRRVPFSERLRRSDTPA